MRMPGVRSAHGTLFPALETAIPSIWKQSFASPSAASADSKQSNQCGGVDRPALRRFQSAVRKFDCRRPFLLLHFEENGRVGLRFLPLGCAASQKIAAELRFSEER